MSPVERDLRRLFWTSVLQSITCAVAGALAGFAFAAGYLADLPAWLR